MNARKYVAMALEFSGLTPEALSRRLGHNNHQLVPRYLAGEVEPRAKTLLRIEEATGLDLDTLDPRIKRGLAGAAELADRMAAEGWEDPLVAGALDVETKTLEGVLTRGAFGGQIYAVTPIRLCDLLEGRLRPLTWEELYQRNRAENRLYYEKQKARRRRAAPEDAPEPPAEAERDTRQAERQAARRAFARAVNPNVQPFNLRRLGPGLWAADGDELTYRLRLMRATDAQGNATEAVRLTATLRRSGAVILDRVI